MSKQVDSKKDDTPVSNNNQENHQNDTQKSKESGGPAGPEPTRFGDWERKGRCIDF